MDNITIYGIYVMANMHSSRCSSGARCACWGGCLAAAQASLKPRCARHSVKQLGSRKGGSSGQKGLAPASGAKEAKSDAR